jgi:hypothetical protein
MTLVPGYGIEDIHLGQTSAELQARLGAPSKRSKSSDLREYWVYSELKFEAIVSRKTARLLSLFFHRGCALAGAELLGHSEEEIVQRFDVPQRVVDGFSLADGEYFDRYTSYDSGISFFFDEAGKVKTVCVTARKRTARASAVASHRRSQSNQWAALQNK